MRDVFLFHHIDDILLTSEFLSSFKSSSPALVARLTARGWLVNTDKMQGPGLSIKYLGVIWSGKTSIT